jgi:FADH2 O2-dependent halogenase
LRSDGVRLTGKHNGTEFVLRASFVVDASGPGGFLARQLGISSGLDRTETRSALVCSHFDDVPLMKDIVPDLPAGPYPDDWAAVHHVIDEGWMYSLRFDQGTTSAGFLLTPRAVQALPASNAGSLWRALLGRYPTLTSLFGEARAVMPIAFRALIQHRLTRSAGDRWVLMPHAFAFVDPLFSTGIAWSLRAVERLGLIFENAKQGGWAPLARELANYDAQLAAEADQIDRLVAGAYESMAHFELFTAQAMLYFATVSFAEVSQRLTPGDDVVWNGFLGVGDAVLASLPSESLAALRAITRGTGNAGSDGQRSEFADWIARAIEPRNIAGLADRRRNNLYPVDFDVLVERHALLGMSRTELLAAVPSLRGMLQVQVP